VIGRIEVVLEAFDRIGFEHDRGVADDAHAETSRGHRVRLDDRAQAEVLLAGAADAAIGTTGAGSVFSRLRARSNFTEHGRLAAAARDAPDRHGTVSV
jgi:hypothetical protein